jgi:hypothetical protein
MSFEELRALIIELVEAEPRLRAEAEAEADAVNEFDTQLTTCRPSTPRTSTLDELVAWLRTAPTPQARAQTPAPTPKPRRRV